MPCAGFMVQIVGHNLLLQPKSSPPGVQTTQQLNLTLKSNDAILIYFFFFFSFSTKTPTVGSWPGATFIRAHSKWAKYKTRNTAACVHMLTGETVRKPQQSEWEIFSQLQTLQSIRNVAGIHRWRRARWFTLSQMSRAFTQTHSGPSGWNGYHDQNNCFFF